MQIGGRCFLVAGEHLREAVGDEKHFGNSEIQKAIALFKKVPSEATYEDLIGQEGPEGEPIDIEEQPLNQEVADEIMADAEVLDTEGLSAEHANMCQQIGWHVDSLGNPVLVSQSVGLPIPRAEISKRAFSVSLVMGVCSWAVGVLREGS